MNGVYAYSKDIWLPVSAALFVVTLGAYVWRRRDVPAGRPFLVASALGCLLLLTIALETAAVVPPLKTTWYQCQYAVQMLAVTAGTCIALDYAYPGRWLTRRNLALLALTPVLTISAIIFAPQIIWQRLWVAPDGTAVFIFAPLGVLTAAYAWGLLLVNAAAFLWLFAHSPQHRWPVALMLCGQVAGRLLILLDVANVSPVVGVDFSVLAVLTPWAMYAIALLGFHILDPLPAARQTALAQMREGMVVLDARQRIASLNPAASAILNITASRAQGRRLPELMPELLPELAGNSVPSADMPRRHAGEPYEISFSGAAGEHWYTVERSQLSDFRGQLAGHLLMLHDITEQKRARAQLLEQERALATLRERERLARELHDGVTQLLAAAHLQVNTAQLLLARGQAVQVQTCLDDLAVTTLQAEADLREYLLGVKSTTTGARPLFEALRDYLVQFTRLCDIPVELIVPPALAEEGLPPAVEVQLVRIIQEALTNVRKHACPKPPDASGLGQGAAPAPCHAWVTFALTGAQVRVVIADDGCGFEPLAGALTSGRYGLRSMEERAGAVGGSLCVTSSPGKGTQVTVSVPRAAAPAFADTPVRGAGVLQLGALNGNG